MNAEDSSKLTPEEIAAMLRDVPRFCVHCGAERRYRPTLYPAYVSFLCGAGWQWNEQVRRSVEAYPCRRGAPSVVERMLQEATT